MDANPPVLVVGHQVDLRFAIAVSGLRSLPPLRSRPSLRKRQTGAASSASPVCSSFKPSKLVAEELPRNRHALDVLVLLGAARQRMAVERDPPFASPTRLPCVG